jgi:hypothetical protein
MKVKREAHPANAGGKAIFLDLKTCRNANSMATNDKVDNADFETDLMLSKVEGEGSISSMIASSMAFSGTNLELFISDFLKLSAYLGALKVKP